MQQRIFENRADHEKVDQLFKEQCRPVQQLFAQLATDIEALKNDDAESLRKMEEERKLNSANLNTLKSSLQDLNHAQKIILGDDFMQSTAEIQKQRLEDLKNSPEYQSYLQVTQNITPIDLVRMINFLIKDLFLNSARFANLGEKRFEEAERAFIKTDYRQRMQFLREAATMQTYFEIKQSGTFDFENEIKSTQELMNILSQLDQFVLELAREVASSDPMSPKAMLEREQSIGQIKQQLSEFQRKNPTNKAATIIFEKLNSIHHLSENGNAL